MANAVCAKIKRRGAVVKGVEHISTYFDNCVSQHLSEWRGFESRWFCRSGFEFEKKINYQYLTTSVAVV